jgi:ethanolamine ammonia-lyase small subunit
MTEIESAVEVVEAGAGAEMSPGLRARLRGLTPARIGLRRSGISLATSEVLDFQLAHGRARDAVHAALQPASLLAELAAVPGLTAGGAPLALHSAAMDRSSYLQHPNRGRKLDEASRERLAALPRTGEAGLAIVLADGLSARAVERHAVPLLAELLREIEGAWRLAPICVVEQGRVAVGDEVGAALGAAMCVVLIGERPGLSSPDSLGAYITWNPKPGRTDAERNCISNIRAEGLSYRDAAGRLRYFLSQARALRLTGVRLKDPELLLGVGE